MEKITAVSIKADRPYLQALRHLAEKKGVTMGQLVRDAVDAAHKAELEPYISFFSRDDYKNSHSTKKSKRRESQL